MKIGVVATALGIALLMFAFATGHLMCATPGPCSRPTLAEVAYYGGFGLLMLGLARLLWAGWRGLPRRHGLRAAPSWQPSEETLRTWEDIRAIPVSQLERVIAVGQTVEASGITVELLSIEARAKGAIIHWRARTERDEILHSAEVVVADQLETEYRVIAGGFEGGARAWQGETFVVPSPAAEARLSIALERFGPQDDRPLPSGVTADSINGPWRFSVDVPPAG